MGYSSDRDLVDLVHEERLLHEVPRRIVDEVGDRARAGAARRTPVARLPAAYRGDFASWIEDRARLPRTLRDAWRRGEVEELSGILWVEIENPDDVAIFVEEDTRPHLIRAKHTRIVRRKDGTSYVAPGYLRFPAGPTFRYAKEVWHPGTQGLHMLRDTMAEVEVLWPRWAERILDEVIREINAGR